MYMYKYTEDLREQKIENAEASMPPRYRKCLLHTH
jgi:hypothetical protein